MAGKSALDVLKKILLSFRRNWGLKLISLFFAAILWNYVIVEMNPTLTHTYEVTAIPSGFNQLKNAGLTLSGDITEKVMVVVELPRSDFALFSKNNIQVTADLSNISSAGNAVVTLSPHLTGSNGTVKSITPQKITVKVEKLGKRAVPVTCEYQNELPEGYEIGSVEIDPAKLEITGADTSVTRVTKAIVRVDLNNLKQDASQATAVELQDMYNQPINTPDLVYDTSCIVSLKILKKKTVKIADPKDHMTGEVAKGYQIDSVDIDQPEVVISGPPKLIDPIDTLTYEAINIDGLTKTTSFSKPLKLPPGVRAVSTNAVAVSVKVSQVMTAVTFTDMKIRIVDLEPGLKVDETFTATVTLTCPELNAKKLKRANVNLYADAAGFAEGTHTLSVTAVYTDPDAGVTDIKISQTGIPVKLVSETAPKET